MIYTVHGYEVVRVKVEGIEADSQEQAIEKYQRFLQSYGAFMQEQHVRENTFNARPFVAQIEYADETAYYLVDEQGDTEFERSRWADGAFPVKPPKRP